MNEIEIDYYLVQKLISMGIHFKKDTLTAFKMVTDGSIVIKCPNSSLGWLELPEDIEELEPLEPHIANWVVQYNNL